MNAAFTNFIVINICTTIEYKLLRKENTFQSYCLHFKIELRILNAYNTHLRWSLHLMIPKLISS